MPSFVRSPERTKLDTQGFDKVRAGVDDPDGEQAQWKVALEAGSLTHERVSSRIGAAGDMVMTPPLMAVLRTCVR